MDISLVHIHTASRASFYRKSILAIISKAFKRKIIMHVHGAEFNIFYHQESGRLLKLYIRSVLGLSDRIIALSNKWAQDLAKIVGDKVNIQVIFNGIEEMHQVPDLRQKQYITILFMGRIGKRKGVYDLIEAVYPLMIENPNIKVILAGDGEVEHVRSVVQSKGLANSFIIPGWIEEKEKYYTQADIFVLPSYNEGLPMSILEACSYGIPVVSSNVGGIPEVLDQEYQELLVEPGDVVNLRRLLNELILNSDKRQTYGQRGKQIIRDKFNIKKIVTEVENLYQVLINDISP